MTLRGVATNKELEILSNCSGMRNFFTDYLDLSRRRASLDLNSTRCTLVSRILIGRQEIKRVSSKRFEVRTYKKPDENINVNNNSLIT